ncbi:hypothetical protein [Paludibaculum fermentans]|uniref:hypothetical protein n=1 Tax=Paludibaculum fermentans TaxID=1473598 RepID=UPI003EB7590A
MADTEDRTQEKDMTNSKLILLAVLALGLGGAAHAQQSGGGSVAITGEVQGSIALYFWQDPTGYQLSEGGASTLVEIGDVSAYGTPNGLLANRFTKGMQSDGFYLSTPFLVQVLRANLPSSTGYTLTAQLGDDDDTMWVIDGNLLSTTPVLISATEAYTTKRQHVLFVKFPFSKAAGGLSDTITFTATAN